MISQKLLSILRCPETREPLQLAAPEVLEAFAQVSCDRGGKPVGRPLDAGLVRADGKVLYPIRDGIPVMLAEESISLES